jgi:hypothetical protein
MKPRLRPCSDHKQFRPDCLQVHSLNPNKQRYFGYARLKPKVLDLDRLGGPRRAPGNWAVPGGPGPRNGFRGQVRPETGSTSIVAE